MEPLYAIAVPALHDEDARWVDALRARHDAAGRALLPPHFTLVFGCSAVPQADFLAHVRAVAARHQPFDVVCRHAMAFPGLREDDAHLFLVPQEGLATLYRLHDELYDGPPASSLRLDIPFIPHVTVASGQTPEQAHALGRALNGRGVMVRGRVATLLVGALREQFVPLAAVSLGRATGAAPPA